MLASTITMNWDGTITFGSSPFVAGTTLSGTYSIDESAVGSPASPYGQNYNGASLTINYGAYSWKVVGGGLLQVFDNAQNTPSDIPIDQLDVAGSPSGSQIGGLDMTWVRLLGLQLGASLTQPPTVLTSQAIPTGPMTFEYSDLGFYLSDNSWNDVVMSSISFSPVSAPDLGLTAGMLGLVMAGLGWVRRKV
jgi:hypothetical protein